MTEDLLALAGALLSLLGTLFLLSSAVGLLRLPDFYCRAHAPAKAATLGLLLVVSGSFLGASEPGASLWLEKALLVLFVLLTVPVATQMLVRAAAARGVAQAPQTRGAPTKQPVERVEDLEPRPPLGEPD